MEFEFGLEHLNKTWFIDLDGVLVKHNGYIKGGDEVIENSRTFLNNIDKNDVVIITTSRNSSYKEVTTNFLINNGIRFNHIIFDLPTGVRTVINDKKPDGTKTAYSLNTDRDIGINL